MKQNEATQNEMEANKPLQCDQRPIEEICAATWEPVYRFIYYRVQNRQEAEDITQETYARALSHIKKRSLKIDKYISYLKTISLNIIRDKWRSNKHKGSSTDLDSIEQETASVEDYSEASSTRILVHNALDSLNEDQRTVIELRIIKGYSVAETARMMGIKEGTVRVMQYRALESLAAILGREGLLGEV